MDPLTEEERVQLGAQQAALLKMQEDHALQVDNDQELLDMQTKAMALRQQEMIQEQEQQMMQQQMQALAEKENEARVQQQMAMIQQQEQESKLGITAPGTSIQPLMAAPPLMPSQSATLPPGIVPFSSQPVEVPGEMNRASSQESRLKPPGLMEDVRSGPPTPLMEMPLSRPGAQGTSSARNIPPAPGTIPHVKEEVDLDEGEDGQDQKLPVALEKMLAFKEERAQQVGVAPEDIEAVEKGEVKYGVMMDEVGGGDAGQPENIRLADQYTDEEEEVHDEDLAQQIQHKKEKNQKRKKKKKRAKQRKLEALEKQEEEPDKPEEDVEIEYVQEQLDMDPTDPLYYQFSRIFDAFKITEKEKTEESTVEEKKPEEKEKVKLKKDDSDSESDEEAPSDQKPKMSKKKMKKMNRLSVAELKQLVVRPDVVEMQDVTARDPKLLVHIKSLRNTVPVPRHWSFKRKYLQGKRGIEKPPFELPEFIQATGIMEMRASLTEKEEVKSMKQKMRERVRPKMGKIDIDYRKLHDAFFRWQTKPKMTIHGDLYYEGKEFETKLKEKKPGNLSDDMRIALGMPVGAGANNIPPPWLIAMQRYGPPPSYPNLKIPGLNAPIPEGCSFGYHAGGWGKPPVDENGKPLYGDVFGTTIQEEESTPAIEEELEKSHWGELESESESEEESSEEEEEEDEDAEKSGLITPGETGLITPSGTASIPVGMETPDMIELRKKRIEDSMDQGGDTPALYHVVPEKKTNVGSAMMGSAHVYDMAAVPAGRKERAGAGEGVEIALNPDELDLDTAAMQAKYEQTVKEQQNQIQKEDLSDMVAEHVSKQSKKRKKQQQQEGVKSKKYKEFKF